MDRRSWFKSLLKKRKQLKGQELQFQKSLKTEIFHPSNHQPMLFNMSRCQKGNPCYKSAQLLEQDQHKWINLLLYVNFRTSFLICTSKNQNMIWNACKINLLEKQWKSTCILILIKDMDSDHSLYPGLQQ